MNYLYHYYAIYCKQPGIVLHFDGTINTDEPITNQQRYEEIKQLIAEQSGKDGKDIIVCAISQLWQEESGCQSLKEPA